MLQGHTGGQREVTASTSWNYTPKAGGSFPELELRHACAQALPLAATLNISGAD